MRQTNYLIFTVLLLISRVNAKNNCQSVGESENTYWSDTKFTSGIDGGDRNLGKRKEE